MDSVTDIANTSQNINVTKEQMEQLQVDDTNVNKTADKEI